MASKQTATKRVPAAKCTSGKRKAKSVLSAPQDHSTPVQPRPKPRPRRARKSTSSGPEDEPFDISIQEIIHNLPAAADADWDEAPVDNTDNEKSVLEYNKDGKL